MNKKITVGQLEQETPKTTSRTSHVINILNFPNEILVEIILYLNAQERLALANSCQRFHTLVFTSEKLLKELDFTEDGYRTSLQDIRQYFDAATTLSYLRQINTRNVTCLSPNILIDTIGKAPKLSDVHIHGTAFRDIWQLGSLLNRLPCLQRLSVDWREMEPDHIASHYKILQKSFGQLTYLAVNLEIYLAEELLGCLQLCKSLKELCLDTEEYYLSMPACFEHKPIEKLENLRVIVFRGFYAVEVEELLRALIRNPEHWVEFQLSAEMYCDHFHLEKDIKICQELAHMKPNNIIPHADLNRNNPGWSLSPEFLLKEVLKFTHKNVPESFCCFANTQPEQLLLNIEDMKGLLKDPHHQISYLQVNHDIERGCDVHLIASAFPKITELVISTVMKSKHAVRNQPHSQRFLTKQHAELKQFDNTPNLDSSFRNLVDHTPRVKYFTLQGGNNYPKSDECWDLDALYLISNWEALETLCLSYTPIENGDFLIEIGRRCKNLQKLKLNNLGSSSAVWCYEEGLFKMLSHCLNLREISIEQNNIGQVSEVLHDFCDKLRFTIKKICLKTRTSLKNVAQLVASIKQFIHSFDKCSLAIIFTDSSTHYEQLLSAVKRLKIESADPHLRINMLDEKSDSSLKLQISNFIEDTPTPKSFYPYPNCKSNFP